MPEGGDTWGADTWGAGMWGAVTAIAAASTGRGSIVLIIGRIRITLMAGIPMAAIGAAGRSFASGRLALVLAAGERTPTQRDSGIKRPAEKAGLFRTAL